MGRQLLKRRVYGSHAEAPVRNTTRRCSESDHPAALVTAVTLGHPDLPSVLSRSWAQLRADAGDCCRLYLTQSWSVR